MYKRQNLLGVTALALVMVGCGTAPQATTPQATSNATQTLAPHELTPLPADASVLNEETTYSVQQMGNNDVYSRDGRVRLSMQEDRDDGNRYRYDDNDDRLRRLRPRFEQLLFFPNRHLVTPFHRQYPIFINVHQNRVFRLNPYAFFIIKRLFPELSDLEIRLLIRRLIITRYINMYHQNYPIFVVPFNRSHNFRYHRYDRDGWGDRGGRGGNDGRGGGRGGRD